MDYMDRGGKLIKNKTGQDKFLNMVYSNMGGRFVMKILAAPVVSRGIGCFMDHWPSAFLIGRFIRKNHIRMSEYECRKYRSFNDFFTRRLKEGMRPVDREPSHLIAPCDAAVMAYPIDLRTKVYMKHSVYTIGSMLRNYSLAAQYMGGYCIVLRLSVDDYHRYCYVDSGAKGRNHFIPGVLHTVNPAVLDHVKIYKENARSYCVIDTKNFGKVVQMEVGAMCVGRITNYHHKAIVRRGQEKGRFEFDGSTVVLLLRRDYVAVDDDILKNSAEGIETKVKLGERIGKALFS